MAFITKCCCCCSLKYGYFTYGIIVLISRICTVFLLWALISASAISLSHFDADRSTAEALLPVVYSTIGSYMGWFVASSAGLFFTLKGIIQKRSILLYPYIVILILELIVVFISIILAAIVLSPWMLFLFLVIGHKYKPVLVTHVYPLLCLIALYKQMKQAEKSRPILYEPSQLKPV